MTGILADEWVLKNFEPVMDIPSGAYFTHFDCGINFKEQLQLLWLIFNRTLSCLEMSH